MSEERMPVATEEFLRTVGALYDPSRLKILRALDTYGELCVCELQEALGMIQSRLSRHLKILMEAGFLRVERRGKWAYYSIRSPLDRFRLQALEEIRTLPIELRFKAYESKASACEPADKEG